MLGFPTTVSMLITNIYNMADTFYVSKISVSASGATGIVFALMAVLQAFGFMFGHGAGSNISRLLGAKQIERARVFTSTSVFLALVTGVLIGTSGLIFPEHFMRILGSTDTILADAKIYGMFILISAPAMTVGCVLNNILRYEGEANFAMLGLCLGGILNLFLDPLLIFKCQLGIAGAGLSTAISQYLSTAVLLFPFWKKKTVTTISIHFVSKDIADIKNIILTGLPSLARQGLNSVSTAVLNLKAAAFGDAAVAAMSIVGRCANLLFSFALGIAQGFQPVCAFNFGAKKYDRAALILRYAVYFTVSFGIIVSVFVQFTSGHLIGIFTADENVIGLGSQYLRGYIWDCIFAGIHFSFSGYFYAYGLSGISFLHNILSIVLIRIPGAFWTSKYFTDTLFPMGLAAPAGSLLSVLICTLAFIRMKRKKKIE